MASCFIWSILRSGIYRNNGYLMVSCNGGLNQMRAAVSTVYRNLNTTVTSYISEFLSLLNFCVSNQAYIYQTFFFLNFNRFRILKLQPQSCTSFIFLLRQICDMVTIARYLNVTLIVPELDKASFWADPRWYFLSIPIHFSVPFLKGIIFCCLAFNLFWRLFSSDFQDIFDVDYFIASLRDEVRILRQLPPRLKRRVQMGFLRSLPPVSWSDITYYRHQVWLHIPFSLMRHHELKLYPKWGEDC